MSTLILHTGAFYRNKLGHAILIVGALRPGDRGYRRGLRFFDHRGSCYTEAGSVQSSFYHALDLNIQVDQEDLTQEDTQRLTDQTVSYARRQIALWQFDRFLTNAIAATSYINVGMGIHALAVGQRLGLFNLLAAACGLKMVHDEKRSRSAEQVVMTA